MEKTDRRESKRGAVNHTAHMATGLGLPLKCKMKDVSKTGARIIVAEPKFAPQVFMIVLKDGLARWCKVIWRSNKEIGVKFVAAPQSLKKEYLPFF